MNTLNNTSINASVPGDNLTLTVEGAGYQQYINGEYNPIGMNLIFENRLVSVTNPNAIIELDPIDMCVFYDDNDVPIIKCDGSAVISESTPAPCVPDGQYIWQIAPKSANDAGDFAIVFQNEEATSGELYECYSTSDANNVYSLDCDYTDYQIVNITNTSPTGSPSVSLSSTDPYCSPVNDGTINSTVTGGSTPYYYIWSDGQEGATLDSRTNLAEGYYSLFVRDDNDCYDFAETTLINSFELEVDFTQSKPCTDTYNGSITVTPANGSTPYTYSWESGETTQTISNIQTGIYTVTATDDLGCQVTEPSELTAEFTDSQFDYPNGLTITSPADTWEDVNGDGKITVSGTVTIKEGVNYSISNAIIEFDNFSTTLPIDQGITASGVIVEPKAKLTATSCTFKGIAACSDKMWEGIQVWGDDFERTKDPRKPLLPNINTLHHGKLVLDNCLVQDALIGVAAHRVHIPFGYFKDHGRGKLTATETTFKNNYIGASFRGSNIVENNSTIKKCDFICDAPLIDTDQFGGSGSKTFIYLTRVKNPEVIANTFTGNTAFDIDKRGTGILSYSAAYKVQSGNIGPVVTPSTPPTPNVFADLSQGIDAYSTGGAVTTVRVKDNRFNNVYQGITANGNNFDEISFNVFNTPMGDPAYNSWAMFLETSSGFLATENTMNTLATNNFTFGIVTRDVDLIMGEVYKNNFNGNFQSATQAEGASNDELQIDCNKYQGTNTFDWAVLSGEMANQGICGDPDVTLQVKNLFDNCSTADESQIYSQLAIFDYSSELPFLPDCYTIGNVGQNPCTMTTSSFEEACPQLVTNPCNPCPSCVIVLENQLGGTPPGLERQKIKGEYVRRLAQEGDVQTLIDFLVNEGESKDSKVLIPTHLQRKEYLDARTELNLLDQSTFENQKYYELFDVLTFIGEDGRGLDSITVAERQIIETVANTNTQVSIQAQAVLAELDRGVYLRFPEQVAPERSFRDDVE